MLVLDTDHFSEWERGSPAAARLRMRLEQSGPEIAVSIVTVEEQMRGWLDEISRHRDLQRQIIPYAKLQRQVEAFADWTILPGTAMLRNSLSISAVSALAPWILRSPASSASTTPPS